jgi:hypothetical protein
VLRIGTPVKLLYYTLYICHVSKYVCSARWGYGLESFVNKRPFRPFNKCALKGYFSKQGHFIKRYFKIATFHAKFFTNISSQISIQLQIWHGIVKIGFSNGLCFDNIISLYFWRPKITTIDIGAKRKKHFLHLHKNLWKNSNV